jgi:hypothetical protein
LVEFCIFIRLNSFGIPNEFKFVRNPNELSLMKMQNSTKIRQNFEKIWFYSEFWTNSDKILKKSDFIQNSEQIWAKFWTKTFFNVLNYSKVLMKQSFQYFLLMKSSINCNILLFSQSKDRNFAQNNNFIYLKFIQNIFGFENI